MFLLCCYDVMFTLETKNNQREVFFGLRDLSVMSLCRKCEPGLTLWAFAVFAWVGTL